ncbi:hypothetical protein GCM10027280_14980 [Micromonospora polyrhachis]|uniref:Uncharacterized protein n=1 Tax=Micromonospora polyrhachis TaxID=1282883 RepID=A0A7W7SPL0_9ACTN|nr:hypothetical protein [Micromonospora polyrhachis]MBB4958614.1 hypothetical protein [Micromonospora polyrhachis]
MALPAAAGMVATSCAVTGGNFGTDTAARAGMDSAGGALRWAGTRGEDAALGAKPGDPAGRTASGNVYAGMMPAADAPTRAGADAEAETGADAEAEADAEAGTDAEADTETGADAEAGTDAEADTETGADAEAETGTEATADAGDSCGDFAEVSSGVGTAAAPRSLARYVVPAVGSVRTCSTPLVLGGTLTATLARPRTVAASFAATAAEAPIAEAPIVEAPIVEVPVAEAPVGAAVEAEAPGSVVVIACSIAGGVGRVGHSAPAGGAGGGSYASGWAGSGAAGTVVPTGGGGGNGVSSADSSLSSAAVSGAVPGCGAGSASCGEP